MPIPMWWSRALIRMVMLPPLETLSVRVRQVDVSVAVVGVAFVLAV